MAEFWPPSEGEGEDGDEGEDEGGGEGAGSGDENDENDECGAVMSSQNTLVDTDVDECPAACDKGDKGGKGDKGDRGDKGDTGGVRTASLTAAEEKSTSTW